MLLGYVFVDRAGKHFRHILSWLMDGAVQMLNDSEYLELLRQAEYYQLFVSPSVGLIFLFDGEQLAYHLCLHCLLNAER